MKKTTVLLTFCGGIFLVAGIMMCTSCKSKKATPPPPAPKEVALTQDFLVNTKSFAGANLEILIAEGVALVTETDGDVTFVGTPVPNILLNTVTTTSYVVKKEVLKDKKGNAVKKQIVLDGFSPEGVQYLFNGKKHSVIIGKLAGDTKGYKTTVGKDKKMTVTPPPALKPRKLN